MEKIAVKTEEFLAYDPAGVPRILSRSGNFVKQAEKETSATKSSSFASSSQGAQLARPIGNSRYFGGFEQYRQLLTPKSA